LSGSGWSVVAAVAGVVAVIVTVGYGEIQRRLARRQLLLAQEQAELQPKLEVSEMQLITLRDAGLDDGYIVSYQQAKVQRELDIQQGVQPTSPPPPDRVLRFKLSNRGRVATTRVVGKLFLEPAYLQPPAMVLPTAGARHYGVSEELRDGYFVVRMSPLSEPLLPGDEPLTCDVGVCVRTAGQTTVIYEFVSAEGGTPSKGEVPLDVSLA
jgi:hypothetical protein